MEEENHVKVTSGVLNNAHQYNTKQGESKRNTTQQEGGLQFFHMPLVKFRVFHVLTRPPSHFFNFF